MASKVSRLHQQHQQHQQQARHLQSTLVAITPILDGFMLRHKNQHRLASWWSRFTILRRAVRRLYSAAAAADDLLAQARWLSCRLVPPAYIAFSQLSADNRHAPLGLALLGILATLNAAVAPLVASPSPSSPAALGESADLAPKGTIALDLGVAISRHSPGIGAERNPTVEDRRDKSAFSTNLPKKRVKERKSSKPNMGRDNNDITNLFHSLI